MKIFIIEEIERGYELHYEIYHFYDEVPEAREELEKLKLKNPYRKYIIMKEIKNG